MHPKTYILCFLLLLGCAPAKAQETVSNAQIRTAIHHLDEAIAHKAAYQQQRRQRTDSLQAMAKRAQGKSQVLLYKELFQTYARIQTDSARYFLHLLASRPEIETSIDLQTYVAIGQAEINAVCGLYSNALEQLRHIHLPPPADTAQASTASPPTPLSPDLQISTETRLYYYHTCRKLYGWMADYASVRDENHYLNNKTQLYRDTIIALQEAGVGRNIVEADRLLVDHEANPALSLSLSDLRYAPDELKPYLYTNIAEAYRQKHDARLYKYYLTLAATSDIQHGITEYMALPLLAKQMYDEGDIDRAYSYLICSMEDANYCKARLRAVEVSAVFPIIDHAYQSKAAAQHRAERTVTWLLAGLAVILIASILYMRRLTKKLSASRRQLARANNQLTEANTRLSETNRQLSILNTQLSDSNKQLEQADRVKEEYIAHYLGQCRGYLDALENFRRELLRMAKNNQSKELLTKLKSNHLIEEEQQRFYTDFDTTFLALHPDFVAQFNELLREEDRIIPKQGELLPTEMRIFALIRLGVTNAKDIAQFLDYSVTTIYNYHSRVRNASIYDRAEFERRLAQL